MTYRTRLVHRSLGTLCLGGGRGCRERGGDEVEDVLALQSRSSREGVAVGRTSVRPSHGPDGGGFVLPSHGPVAPEYPTDVSEVEGRLG